MASYLADTNLLLRLADPGSPQHPVATDALAKLLGQGDEVYVTPQNFVEFWAVATRPVDANGFGWTSERTAKELTDLQARFPLLPDSPEIFTRWLELVKKLPVHGKRVHDARLVAVLQAHALEHLITFNVLTLWRSVLWFHWSIHALSSLSGKIISILEPRASSALCCCSIRRRNEGAPPCPARNVDSENRRNWDLRTSVFCGGTQSRGSEG